MRARAYLVIAAVLVVVAAILGGALLAVDLARVEPEVPDLRVVLDLEPLVRAQPRAVQSQRLYSNGNLRQSLPRK